MSGNLGEVIFNIGYSQQCFCTINKFFNEILNFLSDTLFGHSVIFDFTFFSSYNPFIF